MTRVHRHSPVSSHPSSAPDVVACIVQPQDLRLAPLSPHNSTSLDGLRLPAPIRASGKASAVPRNQQSAQRPLLDTRPSRPLLPLPRFASLHENQFHSLVCARPRFLRSYLATTR